MKFFKTLCMWQTMVVVMTFTIAASSWAQSGPNDWVSRLQEGWARTNYELQGKEQLLAFENLMRDCSTALQEHPASAEILIWDGIIKSTYAGAKGGLGALALAKDSRDSLQQALSINPNALAGSAYTSLGTLYAKVPGWPLGFGDDKKASELLRKALVINPTGIDSNYFYGSYLLDKGSYAEAKMFLLKAQNAPPRPDRTIADKGRQDEIKLALADVHKKMQH